MAACPTATFTDVSAQVIDCLRGRLEGQGLKVPPGNSGTITGRVATLEVEWNEESATLTVEVTDKPWILSCEAIMGRMRVAVAACGGKF